MDEKRRLRRQLRLVHSQPHARMLEAALELGKHLHTFKSWKKDPHYHQRFAAKTKMLTERMRGAEFRDMDDLYGLISFLWTDVIGPLAKRDRAAELVLARDLMGKALEWMMGCSGEPSSDGPGPGIKLVG